MQLLAKFEKIVYMGFRATLNFRKFKVALNPMYDDRLFYLDNMTKSSAYKSEFNFQNFAPFGRTKGSEFFQKRI